MQNNQRRNNLRTFSRSAWLPNAPCDATGADMSQPAPKRGAGEAAETVPASPSAPVLMVTVTPLPPPLPHQGLGLPHQNAGEGV